MVNQNKTTCVISSPVDTYSGYGARSRDFIKALMEEHPEYDYVLLPQRWGNTPWNYLEDHEEEWGFLKEFIIKQDITDKPDIYITITVPNEFQPLGHYNIGVTAGMETTLVHPTWLEGCNRMNLVIVPSEHSKNVFERSIYEQQLPNGQVQRMQLTTKIDVLFEGVNVDTYTKPLNLESTVSKSLDSIKESFNYLLVGHWLPGTFREDRKNIGLTIYSFLDTFKNKKNAPGLIIKTSMGPPSYIARERILRHIEEIRKMFQGHKLPAIYLIHGDLNEDEMNDLYWHPKVKAMVSFTKGEGFGRPLLEFSLTGKPVIASAWSGHVDFLLSDSLVAGKLTPVHDSAVQQNMILKEASWFSVDEKAAKLFYEHVFNNYKKWKEIGKKQAYRSRTDFSYERMKKTLTFILENNYKAPPKFKPLDLKGIESLPVLK